MLIELINNFVAKFIFNQAASVCFLVAVTPQHIANARGQKLRQLIRVLNMMCKPELNFIKDSVIPVLTKVKPGDEEVDLDEVRSNIDETLQEDFKAMTQHRKDAETRDAILKVKQEFIDSFYDKCVMFDPLDREMRGADDADQGTKQKDLLVMLGKLEKLPGDKFHAPFTRASLNHFDKLIEFEFQRVADEISEYIKEAKEQGDEFDKVIERSPVYVQFQLDLEFLEKHSLFEHATNALAKLKKQKMQAHTLISDAKRFQKMDELEKKVLNLKEQMVNLQTSSRMEELAKVLVEIRSVIEEYENKMNDDVPLDELPRMTDIKTGLARGTEDLFTEFGQANLPGLFDLCYELLKLEA